MTSMNKETMTMVAVIVALIATIYMYKELQKTKQEVQILSKSGQNLGTQFSKLTHALAKDSNNKEEKEKEKEKEKEEDI